MDTKWEGALSQFLSDLSTIQDETLDVLARKRELVMATDTAGLAALAPQEEQLITRLKGCLERRQELLDQAGQEGLPASSITDLTKALPQGRRSQLDGSLQAAQSRMRLLQHHSVVNWLIIQRRLLHLSQMLEIIATGGRLQPTYGKDKAVAASGSLMDRAA